MTVAEVVGQIGEIRSRLALLVPPRTSTDSGASFASALSSVNATTPAGATAAATGVTATGAGVTGEDLVSAARQYVGVPYVLGGESRSGMDCSGLVQTAFKDTGVAVPRLVRDQEDVGTEVGSLAEAQPGDLIVLNGGDHIAIWAGDGKAIHAPYPGRTVSEQKVWFDESDVVTIRRVVPATADATAGSVSALGPSTAATGTSAAATSQGAALLAMYGGSGSGSSTSSASDSMSALFSSLGGTASGTTAQQLLAARTSMLGTGA